MVLVAAILFVALQRRASSSDFASYREQMGALVAGDYKLDVETPALTEIKEFFARRHWPADYSVPVGLQGYPLEGAMAVEWHGHRVSLICFGTEDDDSKDMWLFVADRHTVPDAPSSAVPEFASAGKLMTASWSSAGRVYLLAGRGDEESLRQFLPDHGPAQSFIRSERGAWRQVAMSTPPLCQWYGRASVQAQPLTFDHVGSQAIQASNQAEFER